MEKAVNLNRRLFAALWRPWNQCRLGDVGCHRKTDASERLNPFRKRVHQLRLFAGMFVEQEVQLHERGTGYLPVMLLVKIAQGNGIGEQLVEVVDRFFAG